MHKGTFHQEGTVSELTRLLPATIRFSLAGPAPAPLPLLAGGDAEGKFLIETFDLPHDLYILLGWAHTHGAELRELEAGPTRLDDVFRAISSD
jgi:ABC-2 type transport system ATP-binding protein